MQICNCLKTIGSYCPEAKQAMEKKSLQAVFGITLMTCSKIPSLNPKKKSKPCFTAKALEGVCTPELIPTLLCQAQRGFSSNSIHCRQQTSRINKRNPWCRGRFSSTSGGGKNHRPQKNASKAQSHATPWHLHTIHVHHKFTWIEMSNR